MEPRNNRVDSEKERFDEKWNDILLRVKEDFELTDISFRTWLLPLKVYDVSDHVVTLLVTKGQMALNLIEKKYKDALVVAIAETMMEEYDVAFILPEQAKKNEGRRPAHDFYDGTDLDPATKQRLLEAGLNPKYTFDTFVVSDNNNLANAAALAIAENPGKTYNPFFLYGGSGLGKTHLMHSIAHYIIVNDPTKKVIYVTSENFTNDVIEALRTGNDNAGPIVALRKRYRDVDVLLIDDIQFIIGKEATQNEFFNTMNALTVVNKQVIISSDRPWKEFTSLPERLVSRFSNGLTADIQKPNYETRVAILRKKEEIENYAIPDDVIKFIATNIKSNVRELEGALNKLIAYSRLEKRDITVDSANELLKEYIDPDQKRTVTMDLILDVVSEHYNIPKDDIIGKKRNSEIVMPRQIVMYLSRDMIDVPFQSIGVFLGGRDHSTVMHGIQKVEDAMSQSDDFRRTIDIIKKKINPLN